MTTPSDHLEARKRVEAILADWEVAVSIPGDPAVIAYLEQAIEALRTILAPPVTVEEVSSSRDRAQTAGFAREGEIVGPWRIWFDPPPIGTRECDWHYQHDDAEPECPSWMHGHCASREACIAEIINTYEERLS